MMNGASDYLSILQQAIRAPSGHNSQPWLFKLHTDGIEVLPNYLKALPEVDPDHRELFISLGCIVENIVIVASAKGYNSQIVIAENSTVSINLQKHVADSVSNSLLFSIQKQQTNRSCFNRSVIADELLHKLQVTQLDKGVNSYFYQNQSREFLLITDLILRGNSIQMANSGFIRELKLWMRFNRKHSEQMNDGLSYAVFGAPNMPKFIAKLIISACLNEKMQNKQDIKKIQSSSHFMLLTTQHDTLTEWINLGRSMQRLLLNCTTLGISYAYTNQPIEVQTLSMEMQEALGINQCPAMLLRLGFAAPQVYSKRKPITELILTS